MPEPRTTTCRSETSFFELGVVEAADHDVGDVLEAVGAKQVPGRGRREGSERIVAFDPPLVEVMLAPGADRDGAALRRADEDPADVRV